MNRKKSRQSVPAIAAPRFEAAELGEIQGDIALVDGAHYRAVRILQGRMSQQSADDLLLDQVICKHTDLNHTTLKLAQILDSQFDTCDWAGVDLEKPYLRRVELTGCRMLGTVLSEADIQDLVVQNCNAELSRFWESTLQSASFDRCVLRQASFAGSNLSGVIFHDCDLTGADLRGTKLRGTDFRGSILSGIQVGPKELQGAIIDPTQAVHIAGVFGVVVRHQDE